MKFRIRKRIIVIIAGIIAGSAMAMGINRSCSGDSSKINRDSTVVLPPVHLNDTLTNKMSTHPQLAKMDEIVERYLRRWEIVGAQLAYSRNDTLLYVKGYGWADKQRNVRMEPSNIMRIASVSKLVTAVGIMKLCESGKIALSDRVFGQTGILNDTAFTNVIRDDRYFDITVEQLLRHSAGFTNGAGDPMFSTRYIMMQNKLKTPPDNHKLMTILLKRRLGYEPGMAQRYSNVGYTLLSMIIEKVTGMDYDKYMQEEILQPAGCYEFHIAGNYYKDCYEKEVRYYMHGGSKPVYEYNNSGRMVEKCYGENDITNLKGAGAWCASAAELSRLIASIDLDPRVKDILSKESMMTMTEEMPNYGFSIGWNFTPEGKPWERTGSLAGTSALVMKYPNGECLILLTNTSTWKGHGFSKDTKQMFERLRKEFGSKMPKVNLFFPRQTFCD